MSDQEDFDQDLTQSQEHGIAFVVILIFGAMYLFFMKGCQPIASSIGQAFGPPQTVQLSHEPTTNSQRLSGNKLSSKTDDADNQGSSSKDDTQAVGDETKAVTQAQTEATSADSESSAQTNEQQTNLAEQKRIQAQEREAAKIKAEAASLAQATAAQELADKQRFQAKQAELQAGKAELVIPAKPLEPAQQQIVAQASNVQQVQQPKAPSTAPADSQPVNQQKPFNIDDELARVNYTLPDGRSIQIPQQGFENSFKQSILQGDSGQPIIFDRVYFFSGSDLLNPESSNQILGVVGIMNTYQDVKVKLRGHTDSSGADEKNLTLSFKRSLNLKKQLVGLGIDTNRIQVEGLGSSEPISDNESEKGRNKNRRIDLTIIK